MSTGRVDSRLSAITHHQTGGAEDVADDRVEEMVAVEPRLQGARRQVERNHVDHIMARRVDRRPARAGMARGSARVLAVDNIR